MVYSHDHWVHDIGVSISFRGSQQTAFHKYLFSWALIRSMVWITSGNGIGLRRNQCSKATDMEEVSGSKQWAVIQQCWPLKLLDSHGNQTCQKWGPLSEIVNVRSWPCQAPVQGPHPIGGLPAQVNPLHPILLKLAAVVGNWQKNPYCP